MKFLYVFAFLIFINIPVHADISLLIHEAKGFSGETTGAGHSAVYLSDVCADPPPFILRKCRDGESRGTVIATYPGFGATNEYDWFAMPLIAYLYGVDNEAQIPLYANGEIRLLVRETIRQKYLSDLVPRAADGSLPRGRWVEIIGTALNRDLYAFTVRTTPEQDEQLIKIYSKLEKGSSFNVFYKNCADFTKDIMNLYFPKSTQRDAINDFTMTTPKALARSFTKYAKKRPELLLRVSKYAQLDGTIMRSFGNRNFTETAFTSKKYVITEALTMPILIPIFAGTYFATGYFSIDKAYHKYPSIEAARLNLAKKNRKYRLSFAEPLESDESIKNRREAEKLRVFGSKEGWKKYRDALKPLIAKAIQEKLFADEKEVKSFFRDLEHQSEPFYDANGDLTLRVSNYGNEDLLGLTRTSILGPDTDVRLAYKMMLVKLKAELDSSKKNRVTYYELQENWQLLMELQKRSAALPPVQNQTNTRFLTNKKNTPTSKKIKKIFREITH
ncbi:MAG: hypothetical protein OEM82_03620 [Acidobacteriota bacterium]|nr:hypothetical protein [Acidobacteriota bacterium]MDH3529654.1 hypothetical protein [Acidobacteriota bacterium]